MRNYEAMEFDLSLFGLATAIDSSGQQFYILDSDGTVQGTAQRDDTAELGWVIRWSIQATDYMRYAIRWYLVDRVFVNLAGWDTVVSTAQIARATRGGRLPLDHYYEMPNPVCACGLKLSAHRWEKHDFFNVERLYKDEL
ncbi:hypothetical protein NVP2117O_05 [Vibrio phage 2.117.O._10N.261.45.E9]|nr:hypothetical protein NVP1117O_05 [Vibrio phage 1.117.O._10N.261.45.E9]AUR95487.1 hypothetical protein NVP1207B_80 [Vibrio phage 1.207.B._10N.222.51.C2]AUS02297.1 hypothetical protein NVP2117O_05 [Vibrio phage 2.117.O._10N.261.45.E9]